MNKLIYTFYIYIAVFFAACIDESGNSSPIDLPPGPPDLADRTILAYQLVDDDRMPSYLRSDFYEMMEGMKNVDDRKNNLLVFSYLKGDLPYLIYLQKNGAGKIIADTIKVYSRQNPLKKKFMGEVIQYVMEQYPAKDYGLIMESHGDGWLQPSTPASRNNLRWFGSYGKTSMDIRDLREVLEQFPQFNFLLLDACNMQTIEVVYELRNCAKYIISSPSEIPGPGGPYQKIIPVAFRNKANVSMDIANEYYKYYDYTQGAKGEYIVDGFPNAWNNYGVSVSVIKTSELESFAALTKEILPKYINPEKEISVSSILNYHGDENNYFRDFDGLISLVTNKNADYRRWSSAFNKIQIYFKTTPENYSKVKGSFKMDDAKGVTINTPEKNSSITYYRNFQWYKDGGWQAAGW